MRRSTPWKCWGSTRAAAGHAAHPGLGSGLRCCSTVGVIIGILGGHAFSVFIQTSTPGAFAAGITLLTGVPEVIISCVKAALFGLIVGMVACYRGLTIVGGGAKAVGNAVNETVRTRSCHCSWSTWW